MMISKKDRAKVSLEKRLEGYSASSVAALSLSGKRKSSFLAYSAGALALAAGAVSLSVSPASAAIITGGATASVSLSGTGTVTMTIDIDGSFGSDFYFKAYGGGNHKAYVSGVGTNLIAGVYTATYSKTVAERFSYSSSISAAQFATTGTLLKEGWSSTGAGQFPQVRGFIGVKFDRGGNTHYGWVDVFASSSSINAYAIVYKWAYETVPDAPIGAGHLPAATPEPASLALLAMGAGGLMAWRRRRKKAQANNA